MATTHGTDGGAPGTYVLEDQPGFLLRLAHQRASAVFQEVLGALGTDARRTAFVDDLPTNVAGARQVGLAAHRFEGRPGTEAFLRRLGLAL